MTIQITVVRKDATTITAQAETWDEAAREAIRFASDPFYCPPRNPAARIFFGGDGRDLEELTVERLRNALKPGLL
jgi:hypothetical protein